MLISTQAAAILAKSGLGKAELARLWVMSDVDRDGALSRVEFSIAMHLASCSAKKSLPVPAALPDSLAALLPRGQEPVESAAAAGGGGKPPKEEPDNSSVRSFARGQARSTKPGRRDGTGEAQGTPAGHSAERGGAEATENFTSDQAAAEEERKEKRCKQAGANKPDNGGGAGKKNKGKRKMARTGGQNKAEDATATAKEDKPSKKRGRGIFSFSVDRATGARKKPAPEDNAVTTAAASDCGGKRKRAKTSKTDDQKTPAKVNEEATVVEGKLKSASKQRAKNTPKEDQTKASSATAVAASVSGIINASDSAEGLAVAEVLAGGHETEGTGEKESSAATAKSDNGNDEEGTGEHESDTTKKSARSEKKPLSREERDQQYAMTTSERAGYDVVFMQVLRARFPFASASKIAVDFNTDGVTAQEHPILTGSRFLLAAQIETRSYLLCSYFGEVFSAILGGVLVLVLKAPGEPYLIVNFGERCAHAHIRGAHTMRDIRNFKTKGIRRVLYD